jgi:hypothetical protein
VKGREKALRRVFWVGPGGVRGCPVAGMKVSSGNIMSLVL